MEGNQAMPSAVVAGNEQSDTSGSPTVHTARPQLTDRQLLREFGYIDGRWRGSSAGETLAVSDPASGEVIGHVAALGADSARLAVEAASQAFQAHRSDLPAARAGWLGRWHQLILANRSDLAHLMVREQGKPLGEAEGEIDYAASFVAFYAEQARRNDVESITSHLADAEMLLRQTPLGVAALVTPWNFPSAMMTRKAAAALAAGCSVVVHPSGQTPFSALALAELAERAGMPAGLLNVVPGNAETIVGGWLSDSRVRAVSFTGSTEIGRTIYAQSAATVKRLILELGGHAPFIVFADCDLAAAVEHAIAAKFATSGQDCLAANRFFIERPIYHRFCAAFAERVSHLTVGPGLERPDIGPLIHERAVARQERHVEDALRRGARCLIGGGRHQAGPLFFQPTVLADVPDDALVLGEETFGPVAALASFESEDEAIERSNATEFGLVAYLHTADFRRMRRMEDALDFGMVAVNRTKITGAPVPFGGVKQSGLGREGARHGMEAFTELKYICRQAGAA